MKSIVDTIVDKKLRIQTAGRDDYYEDEYHHAYEPTPYVVLQKLVESGYISKENTVIDYGCGKGRVDFYLASQIGCRSIGIEYDERMYSASLINMKTYTGKNRPVFICITAENYEIEEADCFYFFNPFSVEILQSVLGRILDSYYDNPRRMKLFFYYPDIEYIAYLMIKDELMFVDEINCENLFDNSNCREKILVFEIGGCGYN
ncbi:MAG: Methyltransferase domain [Anaerocolumna sp.]|jgi:SAM-dependent methyltransferase|nr:Methyltransferase domain [Anaerocolumna sp.]